MTKTAAEFFIDREHHEAALAAIKALAAVEQQKGGGSTSQDGKVVSRHFSWVDSEDFLHARHIEQAFDAWQWPVEFDDEDNIAGVSFHGEKYGDDDIFFEAIAPYVRAGSYIQMQGEDGDVWRWFFDGATVKQQRAKISFE